MYICMARMIAYCVYVHIHTHILRTQGWHATPDSKGDKVRGEDYGVTAIELELSWETQSFEYATRLCNIGNIHRLILCCICVLYVLHCMYVQSSEYATRLILAIYTGCNMMYECFCMYEFI